MPATLPADVEEAASVSEESNASVTVSDSCEPSTEPADESDETLPTGSSGHRPGALRKWLRGGRKGKEPTMEADPKKATGICTTEMKSLCLAATLFATITVCQAFGALAANSQALMMDCISMGVDAGSMYGNMVAEATKGTPYFKQVELIVGGVSVGTLLYFCVAELLETMGTIMEGSDADDDDGDGVDARIVLAFALAGLTFDVVSLYVFRRSHKKSGSGKEMNMWTAIMHVGADFLRSTTTFVLSILIMVMPGGSSTTMDAYAGLVVGVTILLGGVAGLFGWIRSVVKLVRGENS